MKKLIKLAKLNLLNPLYCFVAWYDDTENKMALSFIPIPVAIIGAFKKQLYIVPRKDIVIDS